MDGKKTMLPSACSHLHAPVRMLPSPQKYAVCKQTTKQIITPLPTLPCQCEKLNLIKKEEIICFENRLSANPPISMLLSAPSHWHTPIHMLPSTCFCPQRIKSVNRQQTHTQQNTYSVLSTLFHVNVKKWISSENHYFWTWIVRTKLLSFPHSHLHTPIWMLLSTHFIPTKICSHRQQNK